MATKPLPLQHYMGGPIVDPKTGKPTQAFLDYFAKNIAPKTDNTLTTQGQITAATPVVGRTEGIGTTVGNLTSSGQLASTDNIAADGTGSPLTGGKRGFVALDTNNRLVGSFRGNAVNLSAVPGANTTLSNDGTHTAINIASWSAQYGDGSVSYNSGSVDPGVFGGPYYIYADDPTFAGGSVSYQFSLTQTDQSAANGRVLVGSITTVNGTSKTGGGSTGGTGGGRGGRQYT